MNSNNFKYLNKLWPKLYEYANSAELYVYSDPHTAIVKLRCFAEQLVGFLYRELNLPCDSNDGFFEKLKLDVFADIIDKAILGKLHVIRMLGNKAAHGHHIDSQDALALIREAYLIGQWLFKTYSDSNGVDYPVFVEPIREEDTIQVLSTINKKLKSQLRDAKEELARLESVERQSQKELNDLQLSLDEIKIKSFKQNSISAAASIDLAPEKTRQLITIHDAFAEYSLTNDQTELVDHLAQFLESKNEQVFLLRGYAGTGKTFITKGLTDYFKAINRNYVLAAPTGKASKVIAKKTNSLAYTIHKTIYSFKDIIEYSDDNLNGSETYKFYAKLAVNEMPVDTVFIVDEASMIADIYQEEEFFRFGTGYLLRDFFKFVNLDHNDHRKKVIFIGDDAQLPPVGMRFSPALDAKYLLREHNLKSVSYELKEVVRQKADSGVMINSMKLRDSLKKNTFNQLTVAFDYPDIKKIEHIDLIERYLESCGGKINGESIIIAYSNADVAAYNRCIREYFFPGIKEVTRGDKVMAVNNNNAHGIFISNGDFGLVRSVLGKTEHRVVTLRRKNKENEQVEETQVNLAFRDIEVGFKDLDGTSCFFEAKVFEGLLYSENPVLTPDESKAIYLDFCIRNPDLKRNSIEFKDTLRADPYFNALKLKFGYAITCHKAQGSEWSNVFVKCKTHQNQLSAEYFRWFYTAITRTTKNLYLLDPPTIKLGSRIKSISTSMIIDDGNLPYNESQNFIASTINNQNSQEESKGLDSFGIPTNACFLLELLNRIKNLIFNTEIRIKNIIHNQFQECYFFQSKSETVRININYNSKDKVSRISSPETNELSKKVLDILTPLNGTLIISSLSKIGNPFKFEEEFLSDFYQRLAPLAEEKNIFIKNIESMDWKQRYTFVQSTEMAVFDIFYNGKKQFTTCLPIRGFCTSSTLVNEVNLMLTERLDS
ncbi:ATP-dependent DNA helicase [Thiofilum flexile]|uniref:ATP-dependent DNA helicase n=1 Tax=Thiofilum flexile TaxID=125627 RepID=UPI00037DE5A3|nr:AAA family ATPase [Thiofilum flexile]